MIMKCQRFHLQDGRSFVSDSGISRHFLESTICSSLVQQCLLQAVRPQIVINFLILSCG